MFRVQYTRDDGTLRQTGRIRRLAEARLWFRLFARCPDVVRVEEPAPPPRPPTRRFARGPLPPAA